MAHAFEELVTMQRTAGEAHAQLQQLQDEYCRPSEVEWTDEQMLTWHARGRHGATPPTRSSRP
ncbi:hypothetical protein ACFYOV_32850 [Streptomyces sp. NPDC005931]|uniref:hypothetical protein n=1 Tax=Streptomyces sp. NPDC005931 TaxID=3364737 RepID=UPI0036C1DDE5